MQVIGFAVPQALQRHSDREAPREVTVLRQHRVQQSRPSKSHGTDAENEGQCASATGAFGGATFRINGTSIVAIPRQVINARNASA